MSPEPATTSTPDESINAPGTSPGESSRKNPYHPAQFGDSATSQESASLAALVERIPEGWTLARYEDRRYGLTRTTRVDGRSISVFAEELGGPDLISANVYRTREKDRLRTCEMPEAKVLAFLRRWMPA